MAQEAQSEAFSFCCTLNDAGDVGHDKRLVVAVAHDTQRGLHGGEGVVGNLRTGIAQRRQQCRLARIGKAHQSDVSQQFQFQDDGHLLHRFPRLGIARCLVRSGAELEVAQSAAAALQQHNLLPVVGNITYILTRLGIVDHRSTRHVDIHVLAIGTMTLVLAAITAMLGKDVALILQVQQCPVVMVAAQDDAAALAAVTAVGTAVRVVLHMAQVHRAPATLTRTA